MCRNNMVHREEKILRREEKLRHKAEKKAEKRRQKDEKRRHKAEIRRQLLSQMIQHHDNVVDQSHSNSRMSPERFEQYVTKLRSMFPDCDPGFIRSCLANETDDHVRRITEKLLTTPYPKVKPESPLTPPTAPPLLDNNGDEFPDEAPPSYEESVEQQSSPPLPKRHQRASPLIARSQESRESQESCDFSGSIKSILTALKPSTVEQACHKYCYTWTRPTPSNLTPPPLSQSYRVLPKDKYSIQKGFSAKDYPTKELSSHDVSVTDWHLFINGLNSILGANSINGDSSFSSYLGGSVSLKWVKWASYETMDDKQMETNILVLNEYLCKWNDSFFAPRKIMVQFMEDKTPTTVKNKQQPFVQYLLVKST